MIELILSTLLSIFTFAQPEKAQIETGFYGSDIIVAETYKPCKFPECRKTENKFDLQLG